MMRVMTIVVVVFCIGTCAASIAWAGDGEASRRSAGLFFDIGTFMGGETELSFRDEYTYRLYSELGVELEGPADGEAGGHRFGLAVSASLGGEDGRYGIGPRLTWRFHPRWAIQGSGGPLWSSRGYYDRGWHARCGLLFRNIGSVNVLWQMLPYEVAWPRPETGDLHAVHAGIMLHGRNGGIVSVATWAAVLAMSLVLAGAMTAD